jgi:hypothetical protein
MAFTFSIPKQNLYLALAPIGHGDEASHVCKMQIIAILNDLTENHQ